MCSRVVSRSGLKWRWLAIQSGMLLALIPLPQWLLFNIEIDSLHYILTLHRYVLIQRGGFGVSVVFAQIDERNANQS